MVILFVWGEIEERDNNNDIWICIEYNIRYWVKTKWVCSLVKIKLRISQLKRVTRIKS